MSILISDFDNLDPKTLSDIESFLVDFIQTTEPNLDLSPSSVLFQFIVRLAAIYHGLNQQNIDRVINSNSLKQVTADPTLADDTVVDNLLSNYFITRQTGSTASGQLRIFLKANTFTSIPSSMTFTSNGVVFKPIQSFSGVSTSEEILSATSDKLIQSAGNGQYSFVINVVATTAGLAGNVTKNSQFTFTSVQNQVIGAVAANDFDGGSDTETNTQLIQRLNEGIATKNLASRTSIKAMITSIFTSVQDVSAIGAGDPEMLRDRSNAFGVSSFGKSDIYVRTRAQPITWNGTKTATLYDATNGLWTMNFTKDEIPSAYYVTAIRPLNQLQTESLDIRTIQRNLDSTAIPGLDFTPAMPDNAYVFTRYQTMAVTFVDTVNAAGKSIGDTGSYNVDVLYQPQVDEINDFVLDRSRRHLAGDYLVKSTLPCMVAIGLRIVRGPGDPDVDVAAVQTAVANVVNSLDYLQGRISADAIVSAVKAILPARTRVQLPVDMRGCIYTTEATVYPLVKEQDGKIWIFNTNELVIPNRPELNVTSRTTSFFLNPENVDVNVLPSDAIIV